MGRALPKRHVNEVPDLGLVEDGMLCISTLITRHRARYYLAVKDWYQIQGDSEVHQKNHGGSARTRTHANLAPISSNLAVCTAIDPPSSYFNFIVRILQGSGEPHWAL